jgi:hypothetical protein
VTETGQRWNDYMLLKFQMFIPHGHEYVTRRSLDSKHAHAETVGFPCLMSGLMIRRLQSLINNETSVTYEIVHLVILEVYG